MQMLVMCLCFLLATNCKDLQINKSNPQETLIIAAAANLEKPLSEIGREFENQTKTKLIFSFGATSNLAKQIENNAPFDIFIAADVKTIDLLIAKNYLIPTSKKIYAQGKLILWWSKDSNTFPNSLEDLTKEQFKRIAIANPEIAPYGKAAKETLEKTSIWSQVEQKIVYGENIAIAYQYAKTKNVEVALISRSQAEPTDKFLLVDDTLHQPLDQALAIVTNSKTISLAEKFSVFLSDSKGRALLEKYGYSVP